MDTTFSQEPILSNTFNTFLARVYGWMSVALAISFGVALVTVFFIERSLAFATFIYGIYPLILFGQIILVLIMSFLVQRINIIMSALMFMFYSLTMGVFLGVIISAYTISSVIVSILAAVLVFGVASLYGIFTKSDLSGWRGFVFMGIFGLIIGTLINFVMFFIAPGFAQGFYWLLTYVGIAIFIVATAYDTQRLKNLAYEGERNGISMGSLAIQGALILYLDFINIFIRVLAIFGKGRN
jgi:FtsH-binding integral membrane protein